MVANRDHDQLYRENYLFPCLRSRMTIWSHGVGSAAPSRTSPLIQCLLSDDSSRFPRRRPHSPSTAIWSARVYRVMQLRTDGVHRRESAGTGPVVLNVIQLTGSACSGNPMDQFLCAPIFLHLLLIPLLNLTKLLQTVAISACGLLNREKRTKRESLAR